MCFVWGRGGNVVNRSRFRLLIGLTLAISALVVMAAPAAGFAIIDDCNGTCGYYEVTDVEGGMRGANCFYINSFPFKLDRITIRPPLMHGDYTTKTKVGWRFKAQRMANGGLVWTTISTSSYQTAKANDAIPAYAGHGFSRRTWDAPSNPAGYRYRIVLDLKWWKPNGTVDGTLSGRIEHYKGVRGNSSDDRDNYCLQSY